MARVFSLKSTPLNMWVMWVYIMCVETWCIRYDKIAKQNVSWVYDKIAKQNVSQVSYGKALPMKYLRKPVVTIYHDSSHSSHVLSTWLHFAGSLSRATRKNSFNLQWCLEFSHSLSHTTHTMKSHIKYRVHKIEQNYTQIWHGIKANTK